MSKIYAAVKAVIQQDGKFLVIKQVVLDKEVWDLPGGRVEFGESSYNTLIREVKEEVSLSVKIGKPLGLFWFFRHDGDQVVCNTFICDIDNNDNNIDLTKNADDSENITEYRWVIKEEFLDDEYEVGHNSLKILLQSL